MINDYIFDFAYGEALNDLYWRKEAGIKECVEKTEEIKKAVRAYADAVIMGEMPCLYNTAHVIENKCIKETDKKLEFGNIQKLINITMKHLYIKYYDTNREAFRCCHAPMDDIMRDFVGRAYKKAFKKYLGISGVSWSSVSEEEYQKYQDAIVALINKSESDCLPIEFDYMNWGKNDPDDIKYEFFKEKGLTDMKEKQPKKLVLFNILDILKRYTDENHRLSQKEIEEILRNEYDMTVDRKTVKSSLMNLEEFGYELEYSESLRPIKNKKTGEVEDSYILSDFYLRKDFEDSELRLLIDSLLFSKHLPYSQCKELVEKLEKLSNKYFKARIKHIATMPEDRTNNKELFLNIDLIDEAISHKKKISFKYLDYDTDLKQHPKKDQSGKERVYVVTPYQMAAKEGKYYLICNYDYYDDISNYRVDRISNIQILDEKAKPFESLKGANGQALNLAQYMREHVYMYSSDSSRVKLRIVNAMISDVIDMFGSDVRFTDKDDTHATVAVKANETSVLQFAKNYAPDVVILEPQELRERAMEDLKNGLKEYGKY